MGDLLGLMQVNETWIPEVPPEHFVAIDDPGLPGVVHMKHTLEVGTGFTYLHQPHQRGRVMLMDHIIQYNAIGLGQRNPTVNVGSIQRTSIGIVPVFYGEGVDPSVANPQAGLAGVGVALGGAGAAAAPAGALGAVGGAGQRPPAAAVAVAGGGAAPGVA